MLFALSIFFASPVRTDASDAAMEHFEKKVRPVLIQHCYRCHSSEKKPRGGLMLDSRASLLKGGDTGPALVPGKPEESLLIKAIEYADDDIQMPPKGKLSKQVIADLRKWVDQGAPFPGGSSTGVVKKGIDLEQFRKLWTYQKPRRWPLPVNRNGSWAREPLDRFILAKIEQNKLVPAADTDRAILIRRLFFDLIGLPPTPEELEKWQQAPIEDLVDRLLSSSHFGERWGRHWLDVARFAESSGGGRTLLFKDAWRYRDYVIRAFNQDKPYDQFVREQLAGDLLPFSTKEQQEDQLTATAFLALGPTNYELQDKTVLEMDVIDEQLDTLGKAFLGLTIGCARCHDHKFDPIPQADYYAMAGILRSTRTLIHDNVSKWVMRPLPVGEGQQDAIAKHKAQVAELRKQIARLKGKKTVRGKPLPLKDVPGIVVDDQQAIQVGAWTHSVYSNNFVGRGYLHDANVKESKSLRFIPEIPADGMYEVRLAYVPGTNRATNTPVTIVHGNGKKELKVNQQKTPPLTGGRFVSLGTFFFKKGKSGEVVLSNKGTTAHVIGDAVQFLPEALAKKMAPTKTAPPARKVDPKRLKQLEQRLKALTKKGPKPPMVMAVNEMPKAADCPLCIRGNIHNPGKVVPRGVLQILTSGSQPTMPEKESGRRQLAEWVASRDNPLTARVLVNRVWHHLFGHGLVRSVDNFGAMGEKPSHPQLLDYLSVTFMENGWSIKKLIRRIVLSRTYQQSSLKPLGEDPENRWFARMSQRRLDAEAIRDAILSISGQLDLRLGGPNIKPGTTIEYGYKDWGTTRSVYTPIFRNTLLELFAVFDIADPNLVVGRRTVSTTATQALYLMNSPFAIEQARHAAAQIVAGELSQEARLDLAYREALGRSPSEREKQLALQFLNESFSASSTPQEQKELWSRLYQVLFGCVDFRYLK